MKHLDSKGEELFALEQKFWNAIKDKDTEAAVALSDEPCVVIGSQGVGEIDKATLAKMLSGDSSQLKAFEFDDVHVQHVADDVAVVSYKVKEDLIVEGQELTLDAFDSSVWVRRGDQWLCVTHTESIAGDPYGRH